MKDLKMVLFDYGNTLIYEKIVNGPKSLEKIYNLLEEKTTSIEEFYEKFLEKKTSYIENHHSKGIDFSYGDLFRNFYYSYGFSTKLGFEEISEIYFDEYAPGFPMDRAREVLDFLDEKKLPYGVISNLSWSGEILRRRIKNILGKDINLVITSADYVHRKPSENLFKVAEKKTGISLENMIYIGDNPLCDAKGSFDSGMNPILFKSKTETPFVYDFEKIDLDFEHEKIDDLIELKEIIEKF